MEVLSLASQNIEKVAEKAIAVLERGGVILYPTDTLYGLGADALCTEAVQKIYAIKGRDPAKPIHALIPDSEYMKTVGSVSPEAEKLAAHFFPGPLTLILPKHPHLTQGIATNIATIGVRIPHHPFCHALSHMFGKPITATSANQSGLPSFYTTEEILAQLGEKAQYIDLVIDAGTLPPSPPSTIVDVSSYTPRILREGAIPKEAIYAVVQ